MLIVVFIHAALCIEIPSSVQYWIFISNILFTIILNTLFVLVYTVIQYNIQYNLSIFLK